MANIDMRGKHHNHARGEKHYRWNNHIISSHGYTRIRVGKNHHLADSNGYAYEHQLIAEKMLGRELKNNESIHHINGIKTDNRPENLKILTKTEHAKLESNKRVRDKFGRLTDKKLPDPIRNSLGQFVGCIKKIDNLSGGDLLDGVQYHEFPGDKK